MREGKHSTAAGVYPLRDGFVYIYVSFADARRGIVGLLETVLSHSVVHLKETYFALSMTI
jgi:hypothetical protein